LCNWPEGEEGEVDKDVLLDHIAKDIHSFSLRALPWADNNGQETDERVNYSADKVYDWLIKNNLSENPDKERPSREKILYTSKYFQRNAYFAGSSAASSSSELESVASWKEELEKWKQKEGSVTFGSRGSDVLSREEADNENASYSQVKPYGAIGNDELSANEAGMPYVGQGNLGEAEAEKVLGPEHPDTLTSVSNLGLALSKRGKYEEAESMHRRALEGREKVLGPEHPDTLTSFGNLGSVLSRQGKYEEAESMYRRALEGRKKVLGPKHLDTLTNSNISALPPEVEASYSAIIDGILAPSDLNTISIRHVRKGLQAQVPYDITPLKV
jgi:tetratricopeptide (TPR) repeat protein